MARAAITDRLKLIDGPFPDGSMVMSRGLAGIIAIACSRSIDDSEANAQATIARREAKQIVAIFAIALLERFEIDNSRAGVAQVYVAVADQGKVAVEMEPFVPATHDLEIGDLPNHLFLVLGSFGRGSNRRAPGKN